MKWLCVSLPHSWNQNIARTSLKANFDEVVACYVIQRALLCWHYSFALCEITVHLVCFKYVRVHTKRTGIVVCSPLVYLATSAWFFCAAKYMAQAINEANQTSSPSQMTQHLLRFHIGRSAVLPCFPNASMSDVRNGRVPVEEDVANRRSALHHIGRVFG